MVWSQTCFPPSLSTHELSTAIYTQALVVNKTASFWMLTAALVGQPAAGTHQHVLHFVGCKQHGIVTIPVHSHPADQGRGACSCYCIPPEAHVAVTHFSVHCIGGILLVEECSNICQPLDTLKGPRGCWGTVGWSIRQQQAAEVNTAIMIKCAAWSQKHC